MKYFFKELDDFMEIISTEPATKTNKKILSAKIKL